MCKASCSHAYLAGYSRVLAAESRVPTGYSPGGAEGVPASLPTPLAGSMHACMPVCVPIGEPGCGAHLHVCPLNPTDEEHACAHACMPICL